MLKTIAKILIVATIASALAISWHTAAMAGGAMSDGDMSPACLTVCLTHGGIGTAAVALALAVACFVLFFFFFDFFTGRIGRIRPVNTAQKDRHRYLMKTMVMLR